MPDRFTYLWEIEGVDVRLLPCKSVATLQPLGPSAVCLHDYRGCCKILAEGGPGTRLRWDPTPTVMGETGPYHDQPYTLVCGVHRAGLLRLVFHPTGVAPGQAWPSPERVAAAGRRAYAAWERLRPVVPEPLEEASRRAWHLLWTCQVEPEGAIQRRGILMSKNWMNQIWSWDNCFNALAVARADPTLACDQLRVMFAQQEPAGSLPDSINNLHAQYCYVKPPIYGWTLRRLRERIPPELFRAFAEEIHEPLGRLTDWWFRFRDPDANGLCEYLHGNDSGWDNATCFDQDQPTEGVDLAAHLVLQMEVLGDLAELRERPAEARRWRERSRRHLRLLTERLSDGRRLFSPRRGRRTARDTGCLLPRTALLLGRRLPAPILRQLVREVAPGGPFLTEFGPATQRPDSPLYQPDGYWRGPIWAPSTHFIWDGLREAGEPAAADELARRFGRLCARDGLFWENYDALTGQGLRCPGYSWTAASFLVLAESLA